MTSYFRRVIRVRAEQSPNVRYGMAYIAKHGNTARARAWIARKGQLVSGLKTYAQYIQDRALLPKGLQDIVLDARFPQGVDDWMFPREWIDAAEKLPRPTHVEAIGLDPAAGGDNTTWALVGREGLVDLISRKTRDTATITDFTLLLINQHRVASQNVLLDDGGGGKQHADYMRRLGYDVTTVPFGEAVVPVAERRGKLVGRVERRERREERYVYKNRRAQLYHLLRLRLDPGEDGRFALPPEVLNRKRPDGGPSLRAQMQPIPMWYDEGRICLPRKSSRPGMKTDQTNTLTGLIGCSPDELEAVLLGNYGLKVMQPTVAGPLVIH